MFENFLAWLSGIFEDDPIPSEVKNLYFVLHRENNYCFVSFAGNELHAPQLFNFEYYPLEAQFFDVMKYDKNFNLTKLKLLVEKLLLSQKFAKDFFEKNIFVGVFCDKCFLIK